MATQLDIIRHQAEAAARNAAARAEGNLRRDASLVNQASRWAGRTMAEGEAALRARSSGLRRSEGASRETMGTCAPRYLLRRTGMYAAHRCSLSMSWQATGDGRCCGQWLPL